MNSPFEIKQENIWKGWKILAIAFISLFLLSIIVFVTFFSIGVASEKFNSDINLTAYCEEQVCTPTLNVEPQTQECINNCNCTFPSEIIIKYVNSS